MKIEVLGTGCPKCQALAANAEAAARKLGLDYELVKITDLDEITRRGVMITPALAIDGQVRIAGKVPTPEQIEALLQRGAQ